MGGEGPLARKLGRSALITRRACTFFAALRNEPTSSIVFLTPTRHFRRSCIVFFFIASSAIFRYSHGNEDHCATEREPKLEVCYDLRATSTPIVG